MVILLFIYMALGYWATGKTIYANYVLIGSVGDIFMRRMVMGTVLGVVLISVSMWGMEEWYGTDVLCRSQ